MKLAKGDTVVELTNEIQISAYIASGYTEVKPDKKKGTKANEKA